MALRGCSAASAEPQRQDFFPLIVLIFLWAVMVLRGWSAVCVEPERSDPPALPALDLTWPLMTLRGSLAVSAVSWEPQRQESPALTPVLVSAHLWWRSGLPSSTPVWSTQGFEEIFRG